MPPSAEPAMTADLNAPPQRPEGPAYLHVRDLQVHFPLRAGVFRRPAGAVKAVDGVSFEVRKGETLGLVGESGCGKSTLGRAITRLEEPTDGQVFFEGKDLAHANKKELFALRRDVQIIFQDPYASLNPRMTVGEIVREPLLVHSIGTKAQQLKKVRDLLEIVGLTREVLDRYPHEFSGGQRQRIGIARALALEPKLVIADEPVSALDVSVQSQVLNLMLRLQRELDLTYIFITHDLSVVQHISDRVAIMYLGLIVEEGPTEQIFAKPAHPYTRALVAAIPVPDPASRTSTPPVTGEAPSPINPPVGCNFHPRCPYMIESCKAQEPPLEPILAALGAVQAEATADHLAACIRKHEI
jgi:oligopeptide/dipeptide ABC transporter ATP-binding protein